MPIGVIGDLNRRLAARAQPALVDRMRLGLPSSFLATPICTTPAWPLRTVSTSASMTRTVTPQPALHSGHTLGFHSATPGTRSSSGTKRMS